MKVLKRPGEAQDGILIPGKRGVWGGGIRESGLDFLGSGLKRNTTETRCALRERAGQNEGSVFRGDAATASASKPHGRSSRAIVSPAYTVLQVPVPQLLQALLAVTLALRLAFCQRLLPPKGPCANIVYAWALQLLHGRAKYIICYIGTGTLRVRISAPALLRRRAGVAGLNLRMLALPSRQDGCATMAALPLCKKQKTSVLVL